MATFNKFNQYSEDLAKKVHNLGSDALTVALCAAANAPVATNSILTNLTQISYTNLSTRVFSITSCAQASGVLKLVLADLVLTASGGSVATFRYAVLYNDTPTSPADPLIGWWDYGADITLLNDENFTVDSDQTGGIITIM